MAGENEIRSDDGGSTMRYVREAREATPDDAAWYPLRTKVVAILEPFFLTQRVPDDYRLSDLLCGVCNRMEKSLPTAHFADRGKFRSWLMTLADHEIKDAWRRFLAKKRGGGRAQAPGSVGIADPFAGVASDEASPSAMARVEEIASIERTCVAELPELERRVYVLRRSDRSYAEIAATLGEETTEAGLARLRFLNHGSCKRVQECMLRKLDGYESVLGQHLG